MNDYTQTAEHNNDIHLRLEAHPGQTLIQHLSGVSQEAARLAQYFGGADHARLAGLLHDLGKAENEFQKRIHGQKGKDVKKEPHAHHGAALLLANDPKRGGPVWPVAFAINGHHAGLHDRSNLQKRAEFLKKAQAAEEKLTEEKNRLTEDPDWNGIVWPIEDFGKTLPAWLDDLTDVPLKTKLRAVDLYTRFLFSALIDADRLDTERHDDETKDNFTKRHAWRFGSAGLAEEGAPENLFGLLSEATEKRREIAKAKGASLDVLEVRSQVLASCELAAASPRGVFTLTVPTGGGKTLASLSFALRHIAAQNQHKIDSHKKLRRIIVVIPYLNIIQQTAKELTDVFGHSESDPVLLEHHSQAQDTPLPAGGQAVKNDVDDYSRERTLRQLAAENWDAPIIVTTSVQFFDSLFSRRPADARKLHNIAQSVIIFDEVQTFPPLLMQPILDALGELTSHEREYGCSLVLCTATQPALLKSADLPCGLAEVKHIIEEPQGLFQRLKRTSFPELESKSDIPTRSWPELTDEILSSPNGQGLVVVNTRRHARELFEELRKPEKFKDAVFHLSTWMTPVHRIEVLSEISRRLTSREPCFLVSTQCIEAGVDVDFPAVWRAFGPYDAIAQAAGRCNRNGALKDANGRMISGQVHVFRPKHESLPSGIYRTATSQTELLRKMTKADPHEPSSFELYFRLLYQLTVPDECEIQQERQHLHFEKVASLFNLIDTFTVPMLVPRWLEPGSCAERDWLIRDGREEQPLGEWVKQRLHKGFLLPDEWRRIQPYILNLDLRNQKQRASLDQCARPAFREEKPSDATLWILDACSLYQGGLHGSGFDANAEPLNEILGGL